MDTASLVPIPVPHTSDSAKVVGVAWSDETGVTIEVASKRDGTVRRFCVRIEQVEGVRVLGELDISGLWLQQPSPRVLSSTWLFEVKRGGWLELESTRCDFYTKHVLEQPREFLIAGYQECCSVLAYSEPVVSEIISGVGTESPQLSWRQPS